MGVWKSSKTRHGTADATEFPLNGLKSRWPRNIDPGNGHLYLAVRQLIWLGKVNGYRVLFKPMNHALLTQITYPGTRLSLRWKSQAVTSSDSEDGLRKTASTFPKPENSKASIALVWSGPESEISPRLLVETQTGIALPWRFTSHVP